MMANAIKYTTGFPTKALGNDDFRRLFLLSKCHSDAIPAVNSPKMVINSAKGVNG
jgi:hypothetical protein